MLGTSLDLPKKHVFWEAYSEYSPNGLTKFAEISYSSYGANLQQSSWGAHPGGGRQGGELDVWAYMKGYLNDFFKTDPCAREVHQRSIIAPNMVMCALNVRPLQEVNFGPSLRLYSK